METIHFHLQGSWQGDRFGQGHIATGELVKQVSIPSEMQGPGIGTNPDEMLLGAASTCYMITLAALFQTRKLDIASFTLASEGIVEVERGVPKFKAIIHRPSIKLPSDTTDEQITYITTLVERAERSCMISQALHGNVQMRVEPTIIRS
ncbi:SACOL1771 family peroxiredoxin [Paenibacillus sp. N1-5-1-14]|uniref:SACOL1771 family peroxiredoxin n=1 Tax=Paenibacillus radicibacter TaxID=2972488 RepID=UPI002159409F|nr:SACOL1771 family peroxiredoxin [Paenibacillus radicibacter]MCR8642652.1 SACOL1771 family peroxiredoxin [Paenibacillus radicibacter]